jgi:hypothetical protein
MEYSRELAGRHAEVSVEKEQHSDLEPGTGGSDGPPPGGRRRGRSGPPSETRRPG